MGNHNFLAKIILEGENFRGTRNNESFWMHLNCSSSDIILTNFSISFPSQLKKKKTQALGRFRHLYHLSWAFIRSILILQVINKAGRFLTDVLLIVLWSTLSLHWWYKRPILLIWIPKLLPIVCYVNAIQSMKWRKSKKQVNVMIFIFKW